MPQIIEAVPVVVQNVCLQGPLLGNYNCIAKFPALISLFQSCFSL